MRIKHFFIIITTISQILHGMEQHRSRSTTSTAIALISLPSFQQLLAQVEANAAFKNQTSFLPSLYQRILPGHSIQIITPNPQPTFIVTASNMPSLEEQLIALYRTFSSEESNAPIPEQPTITLSNHNTQLNSTLAICQRCDNARKRLEEKPFRCPICRERFATLPEVTNHIELIIWCPLCPRAFCTKILFFEHLEEIHDQSVFYAATAIRWLQKKKN